MWTVEPDPVAPADAIAWFRARLPLTPEGYASLESAARARAFTVSGLATLDMVQDVFNRLQTALEQGVPFEAWQRGLPQGLQKAWGKGSAYRLQTIFDTNLQSAYSAGRWKSVVESGREFVGLEVVDDGRTSNICIRLRGVVLPVDDPFWKTKGIPPYHYRCRTVVVSYRQADMVQPPKDFAPLEGFGGLPNLETDFPEPFEIDPSKYDPRLWAAYQQAKITNEVRYVAGSAKGYGFDAVADARVFEGAQDGIAAFVPARNRIELNQNHVYWTNPESVLRDCSTQSRDHLVRHEVAHGRMFRQDPESYFSLNTQTWTDVPFADAEALSKSVSRAASLSPGEFVSEVFAGLEAGKVYADDVMQLYKLLHGGAL
jgi:SPP1 gp7 family putative phage head morphogenesis protein